MLKTHIMYLNFLQISSIILLSIFILAFAYRIRRVFSIRNLRNVWATAKKAGNERFAFLEKVRGYKARGWKEFIFRRGKVSVWDEDKSKAAKKLATAPIMQAQAERKRKADARKARRSADRKHIENRRKRPTQNL